MQLHLNYCRSLWALHVDRICTTVCRNLNCWAYAACRLDDSMTVDIPPDRQNHREWRVFPHRTRKHCFGSGVFYTYGEKHQTWFFLGGVPGTNQPEPPNEEKVRGVRGLYTEGSNQPPVRADGIFRIGVLPFLVVLMWSNCRLSWVSEWLASELLKMAKSELLASKFYFFSNSSISELFQHFLSYSSPPEHFLVVIMWARRVDWVGWVSG